MNVIRDLPISGFRLPRPSAFLAAGCLALSACAGAPAPGELAAKEPSALLTADDRKLDCGRITGRMKVRILSLRGAEYKVGPSDFANGVQGVTGAATGGGAATAAAERANRDRAELEALNALLAEKKCPTFDLEKELAQRPSAPPPAPRRPTTAKP